MLETIFASLILSVAAVGVLLFLARSWFESRVKSSIEYEYKRQFELFQRQLNQKQQIELVADLIAQYANTPHSEPMTREQRTKLNKLSFQASLWLPGELAIELAKRLQNAPDAKSHFEIVLSARHLLTGDKSIGVEHVTYWDAALEKKAGSASDRSSGLTEVQLMVKPEVPETLGHSG